VNRVMSGNQVVVRQEDVAAAKRLTYLVRWSAEDVAYLASSSEIPGSTTHGPTPEDALANAIDVAALWLAAYQVWGKPAPEPGAHRHYTVRVGQAHPAAGMSSAEIRAVRETLGMSQPVFASGLSVSVNAVRAWEQGLRQPNGTALRLLAILREYPAYGERLLAESTSAPDSSARTVLHSEAGRMKNA
jgi:DNA-binding transcriptional regulator YiaG